MKYLHRPALWIPASIFCLILLSTTGCVHRADKNYVHGQAAKTAIRAQCLNPDGGENVSAPPEGMPGLLANKIYRHRYITRMSVGFDTNEDGTDKDSGRFPER